MTLSNSQPCVFYKNGCRELTCNGRGEFSLNSESMLCKSYTDNESYLWRTDLMPMEQPIISGKTLESIQL